MNVSFRPPFGAYSNLLMSLLTVVSTVTTNLCRGAVCERFHCSSDMFPPRVVDPYLRRGATFNTPCSCLPDWNSMFCNHTQTVSTGPGLILPEMPTICICRKFDDNGSKCQQFITRCFKKKNQKCTCCFNQPSDFCDHLTCKNGEPEFSSSNTSCVCHHNPADYPYHICKSLYTRNSPAQIESTQERQKSATRDERRQQDSFSLLGLTIPSPIATYIIIGLLVGVILLTAIILVVGNRKRQKRREDNLRQRQNAHEALLMQRADDDRYLPTV
ncbi:hypothetical protein Aduo_017801 [Ancylostoma duodenale]